MNENDTPTFEREEMPAPRPKPMNWSIIMARLSVEAPDESVIAARNVATSSASYLRRRFGVEALTRDIDPSTGKADRLLVKWITGTSQLDERGEAYLAQRRKAREVRERLAKKKGDAS